MYRGQRRLIGQWATHHLPRMNVLKLLIAPLQER